MEASVGELEGNTTSLDDDGVAEVKGVAAFSDICRTEFTFKVT